MAESGGSSTISGVGYEQWVFVHFMVQIILNENDDVTLTPQKVRENINNFDSQIQNIAIDDLVKTDGAKSTHYNIKQHATNGVWNVSQLKSMGIIADMKKQHELTPERELILLSQSDSPIIREMIRLRGCSSRVEIESAFSKDLFSQWNDLKLAFDYDDWKMLEISKKMNLMVIDEKSLQENIETSFKIKFNTPGHYSDTLFAYAFSRSKAKMPTTRKDILKYLSKKGIIEKTSLSDETIMSSLKNSTINLEVSVSPFAFEHIDRQSTSQVLDWILKERNWSDEATSKILTVAGKAGMGKTTVLQDVLKELHQKDIPVLAIKADVVSFNNSDDLKQCLELPDTVERILARISEISPINVLLIDQIDALSLSLSTDRTKISRYKELISRCLKFQNVLIVLSCRTYDLNNDLDLKQYSNNRMIEVGPLTNEEILKTIVDEQISPTKLSKETLELLRTPLHLSIFVHLSKSNNDESWSFKSLNDLYNELLNRTVFTQSNHKKLWDLIVKASNLIYENQSLCISRTLLEIDYFEEIKHLLSSGILQQSRSEISFFHQTFFDYSLARNYVVSGKLISEELTNEFQGLYQRPRVKAVLEYLYQTDKIKFFKECNTILFEPHFRVHIKYLVINIIGYLNDDDRNCKALGHKIIGDDSLRIAFLKSIMTQNWVTFLINDVNLELNSIPLQMAIYHICNTNRFNFSDQIIDLLAKYWNQLEKERATNCLSSCANIQNATFIKLFKENKKQILEWDYLFSSILKSAIEQCEYNFVGEQFHIYYEEIKHNSININKGYLNTVNHQTLENLWNNAPEVAYKATKKLFIDICQYSQYEIRNGKYLDCEAYSDFYGIVKDGIKHHHHLYQWLSNYLSELQNNETLLIEIDDFLNLEFEIIQCLVLDVIIKNPILLIKKGSSLLLENNFISDFDKSGSLLQYLTGELIHTIYPHLDQDKQDKVYYACMSVKEWFVSDRSGVKRRNKWLFENRYKLISRIPFPFISKNPEKKRQLQEFQRRFGIDEWKRPKGIQSFLSSGNIPLPEKAYESMTLEELRDSFLKIERSSKYRNREVTLYGHAGKFHQLCKQFPLKYFNFVKQLIDETPKNNVNPLYTIEGVLGLLESPLDFDLKIDTVHFIIERDDHFSSESYNLMRMVSHFSQSGQLSFKMLQFLTQKAISISQKEDESFHYVLEEIFRLVHLDEYKKELLDTVETISKGRNEKMKLELLRYLAQLNSIDKFISLNIFNGLLLHLTDLSKYEKARESIQYMIHVDLGSVAPIIRNAIQEIEIDKTKEWYGQLIGWFWINEYEFSTEFLNAAETKSSVFKEGILSISIDVVKQQPIDSNEYKRAMQIISKYLDEDNENMYNEYQSLIRFISKDNFINFNQFLINYIKSKVRETKHRHRSLNEKLFELASNYPKECITLCELDLGTKTFSEQFINSHIDKNIFDVLVKAYNSLSSVFDDDIRIKTLDLMDKTLEVAMLNQTFDLAKTFQTISQHEDN